MLQVHKQTREQREHSTNTVRLQGDPLTVSGVNPNAQSMRLVWIVVERVFMINLVVYTGPSTGMLIVIDVPPPRVQIKKSMH